MKRSWRLRVADTNRGILLRKENERTTSVTGGKEQRGEKTDVQKWMERGEKFMLCSFSP